MDKYYHKKFASRISNGISILRGGCQTLLVSRFKIQCSLRSIGIGIDGPKETFFSGVY